MNTKTSLKYIIVAVLSILSNTLLFGQTIQIVDNNTNTNVITTLHGFCTGPNFNYDVYWDDTSAPTIVEVVNDVGTVLGSGTTSPIRITIIGNDSTSPFLVRVQEQGNITNISSTVSVIPKDCEATELNEFNYTSIGTNNSVGAPYIVSAGVTHIRTSVIGGGGNGARRGGGNGNATGGGGGGASAISTFTVTTGEVFNITVASGRSGSLGSGTAGSSRIINDLQTSEVLARGGSGRGQGSQTGGLGGNANTSIGQQTFAGGRGGNTNGPNNNFGRGGGAAHFTGPGTNGSAFDAGVSQSPGGNGATVGSTAGSTAGGGGAGKGSFGNGGSGGNGARGLARIETYNTEVIAPTLTINQASNQNDPSLMDSSIIFTVVFSEPINVSSFTCEDILITGSSIANCTGIAEVSPNDGTSFEVSISPNSLGSITVSVPEASVHDLAGNNNQASTSMDNTVIIVLAPGGVAADLNLWLKADAGVYLDDALTNLVTTDGNNIVEGWLDQSPNAFSATTMTLQPDYVSNGINFNPVVRFQQAGGGDGLISNDAIISDFDKDYEIYYVINNDDDDRDDAIFMSNSVGTSRFYLRNDDIRLGATNAINTTTVVTEPYLITTAFNNAANTASIGVNAATTTPSAQNFAMTPSGPYTIGHFQNSNNDDRKYDGDIGEIIIYDGIQTPTERQQIQSYLAIKYGITLNSGLIDYLASDGSTIWTTNLNYNNDIAGIGVDDAQGLFQPRSKSVNSNSLIDIEGTGIADTNFLVWANNNGAVSSWNARPTSPLVTSAPIDYAILSRVWQVQETGDVGTTTLTIDVDDANLDMTTFIGDLYLVKGPNLSVATPVVMTNNMDGTWTLTGVDFADGDLFSFAVLNKAEIEFSTDTAASTDESSADNMSTILVKGIVNASTNLQVSFTAGINTTATNVDDFTFAAQTINIPAGIYDGTSATALTITMPALVDDNITEGNETIFFEFSNLGTGIAAGDADSSTVTFSSNTYTITDDDSVMIEFASAIGASTNETAANNFGSILVKGETTTDFTFNIELVAAGTTASAADYGFTSPVTLTILANTVYDGTLATAIPITGFSIVNDVLIEGNETVVFDITNLSTGIIEDAATNGDAIIATNFTYTITDDDVASYTVTPTTLTIPENAGTGTFTIVLNAQPLSDVVIDVSSNATSEGLVDISQVTFTNTNWDQPQTITITGVNDNLIGDDSTNIVTTINDTGSADAFDTLSDQTVAVTFANDDTPNITVTPSSLSLIEGTTGTFTIALTAQPVTDVVVDLISSGLTEVSTNLTQVTFTNGNWNTPQTITVTAVEDTVLGDEAASINVAVNASNSDNDFDAVVTQIVNVAITNNDVEIELSTASNDNEAMGGNLPVLLIDGTTTVASTISVSVSGGDAVLGTDFSFTNPQIINIPAGTYDGTAATGIAIPTLAILDENEVEDNETIDFEISLPTGQLVIGTTSLTTYTITNDDSVTVEFNLATANDAEASGGNLPVIFITGEVTNPSTINVELNTSTTATVGSDFTFTSIQVVTIPAGVYDGTVGTAIAIPTLAITDDSLLDPAETVVLSMDNPTGDLTLGTILTHTYTINDDETVGFTVSETNLTIDEDGGVETFDVVLNLQPVTNVVIDIISSNTNETTTNVTQLIFTPTNWNTSQTVTVNGVNDNVIEGTTENITVAINDISSDNDFDALLDQIVTITLTDDDIASFTVNKMSIIVNENGGTGVFTVVLDTQPNSDVVFDITSLGTPLDDAQVTLDLSTLTFTNANWNIPQTITVTGINDAAVVDHTAVVTVAINTLGSDDNFDALASQDVNVALPNEDIVVGVSLTSAGPFSVNENAGTVTAGVVLGSQPGSPVVVNFDVLSPAEGFLSMTTMTFTPLNWDIPQLITFTGTDDLDITGDFDITVEVTVDNALSDDLFDNGQVDATITILDDDFTDLEISMNSNINGSEPNINGSFEVVLDGGVTNNTGVPITGNVAYTGTAIDGSDFNGDATFSIADGGTNAIITTTIVDDFEVEGTEIITAEILNPSIGVISSTSMASINLVDDDVINVASVNGTEIFVADGTAIANGVDTEVISVQLKDASGNNLLTAGVNITFTIDLGSGTLSSTTAVTDVNGLAQITITNTIAETVNISATVDDDDDVATPQVTIINGSPAEVVFSPDNSNPNGNNVNTTISATSPVLANGIAVSTVTVTLADTNGNLLTTGGSSIVLSNTGSAMQIGSITDVGNGSYTALFTNTISETVTITGTVDGQAIIDDDTISFIPDNSNPDPTNINSTITATSPVLADGIEVSTVTVTLADVNGNVLDAGGSIIVITATGSAVLVSGVTDNADGTYTATYSNLVAEEVVFSATVGGVSISTGDPTVVYTPDNSNPDPTNINSTITATSPVLADGIEVSTVTVTLADVNGNVLDAGGSIVAINATGSAVLVSGVTDNADGTYTATYSNLVAEEVVFSATVGGVSISTGDPTVVYEMVIIDVADPTNFNTTITATSPVVADGIETSTITVQLSDTNGDFLTVSGGLVELTTSSTTADITIVIDNNDGTYTATIRNNTPEIVTISGTINNTTIIDTADIEFTLCTLNCDMDYDGICDSNCDTNNDNVCDFNCEPDQDADGDGVKDTEECPLFPFCRDSDDDGIPDYQDVDDDDDGILTENEVPPPGGGNPQDYDSDDDGIPDYLDPYDSNADNDEDGVTNNIEDTDNDGNPYNDDCNANGIPNFLDASPCSVIIPKGFSPNGDGINDTWVINGIERFPNNEIQLFNKWGNRVFYAKGYQNNWDGISNAKFVLNSKKRLPAGAYLYIIDLKDNSLSPLKGWIYINY